MTRLAVLFLMLSLLAPLAAAAPPSEGDHPFTGLFDSLRNLLDWAFFWLEPENNGAFIVPSGVNTPPLDTEDSGAYIVPSGGHILPPPTDKHGAMIIPSGAPQVGPLIVPTG